MNSSLVFRRSPTGSVQSVRFSFCDVGHGSCTHIVTPNKKHILVDVGGSDNLSIPKLLKSVSTIDCLIITHPHLDHIRGICDLVDCGLLTRDTVFYRHASAFPVKKRSICLKMTER
jgi:beta-lactamase superfamily II metal-dependent hydrolase